MKSSTNTNFAVSNPPPSKNSNQSEVGIDQLIVSNQLEYKYGQALSVVKQRRLIQHHSTLTTYSPSNTMSILFNNSDDLILGPTSVLYFSIYTDNPAHFGEGSALNLFSESTTMHRTGVELSREINKNVYMRNKIPWTTTPQWRERNGSLMYLQKRDEATARAEVKAFYDVANGGGTPAQQLTLYEAVAHTTNAASDVYSVAAAASDEASASSTTIFNAVQEYVDQHDFDFTQADYQNLSTSSSTPTRIGIPLSMINGLFSTDKMIPHFMTSGLRLNLSLDTVTNALISVGTAATTFTITNVYVAADSFIVNDAILEELNEKSADGNLLFAFDTYSHVPKTITAPTLHMTAEKALSTCARAWAISRQTNAVNTAAYDSLGSEGQSCISEFRYRLGSQYYPSSSALTNTAEMYHWTMGAWQQLGHPTISYDEFNGTDLANATGYGEWTQASGNGMLSVDLSRSVYLDLSGMPVSGIQQVVLDATFTATASNRTIDLFTDHERVCRPFLFSKLSIRE